MKICSWCFLLCLSLLSCNNSTDPVSTVKNEIQVKVYNTSTWNSQTNKMDSVVGASVDLITDSSTITVISDNKGIATFTNVKSKVYYLVASKDNQSNLLNKETLNNKLIGNLIVGVYLSQADIQSYANYSNASVGGVKFVDANMDGLINANYKVLGKYFKFEYKYQDINADGIITLADFVNGSLVKADNISLVSLYIGK